MNAGQRRNSCGGLRTFVGIDPTYDHTTSCLIRSPMTTAGSVPAGLSWAFWCRLHACDRRVYGLLALLRGRSGTASSSSLPAFALKQDMQTPIAKSPPLRRQILQPISQISIRWPLRHTSIDTWVDPSQGACPFLIVSFFSNSPGRCASARTRPQKFFPASP